MKDPYVKPKTKGHKPNEYLTPKLKLEDRELWPFSGRRLLGFDPINPIKEEPK